MQSERSGKTAVGGRASARGCAGGRVRGRLIAGFKIPAMAVAGIAMLVLSCGDGAVEPPPPPAPVATTVTVNPGSAALSALGATARFTAEVRDQNGQAMAGAAVAWASSNASVATVDASGVATAAANGSATITATAGSVSGTAAVTVAQVVSAVAVSPAADTLVAFGDTVRLMAEATDANGHSVEAVTEFSWSSSDTLVARVDDSGLVESLAEGAVVVMATASEVSGEAALNVVAPLPTAIVVSPDSVRLTALGQTVQLAAEVREQSGRVMGEAVVGWSSEDTLVAAVDSAGPGDRSGRGNHDGDGSGGRRVGRGLGGGDAVGGFVVVSPEESTIALGDTLRLDAEAFDENGHRVDGAAFSWSSSDAGVARVDEAGWSRRWPKGRQGSRRHRATPRAWQRSPWRTRIGRPWWPSTKPPTVRTGSTTPTWLTDAPLGDWYGVEADGSGRVVQINLEGDFFVHPRVSHGLRGSIPPELGNLANLENLDLSVNDLEGTIPPELGNLANLKRLDLAFNPS